MRPNHHSHTAAPILSIDVGGTKILTALVSEGRVLLRDYGPTCADEGTEGLVRRIAATARALEEQGGPKAQPVAAAAAIAGIIDTSRGVVTTSPNIPFIKDAPLRDMLQRVLGMKTVLLNDATAAAFGEHRAGAGRGTRNMMFITVSTGIGGGAIINGELYQGSSGAALEAGHMVIEAGGPLCACGNRGCLETLASGTAIARYAREAIANGRASTIPENCGGIDGISAEGVARAADGGDHLAQEVISRAAAYLGIGLLNLVHIFNPDMIVIGGGVSLMGERLLGPAREVVNSQAFRLPRQAVRILPAMLGVDAGIIGAAIYAATRAE